MSKRTQNAVLCTHRYYKEKDPYTYYYSHLFLFLPWCNEDDLVQNPQQIYDEHCLLIEKNAEYFNHHEQEIDAATVYLQQHGPPEHVWDTIAPAAQAQNISDELEGPSTIRDMDEDDLATLNDQEQLSQLSSVLNKQFTKEANKDIMTNREYCKAYHSLNDEQRTVVLFNRNWCKMAVAALRNRKAIQAYQLYVSGPGGTGKSYIIKMIHHDINYFFNLYEKAVRTDRLILLPAYTGTAAFNIDGITQHSAVCLPTSGTENCARAQLISQHVDAGQLNVPP